MQNLRSAIEHIDRPITISIEGNIGVGKTTLFELCKKWTSDLDVELLSEPVGDWCQLDGGINLLEHFYEDPRKHAFAFQMHAFVSRLRIQSTPLRTKLRIVERSSVADRCFAKNCRDAGLISDVEMAVYDDAWNFYTRHVGKLPDGFLYLRATPQTCQKRTQFRGRREEHEIPLMYLQDLHAQHEEWLCPQGPLVDEPRELYNDAPVVVVDAEPDLRTDSSYYTTVVLAEGLTDLIRRLS